MFKRISAKLDETHSWIQREAGWIVLLSLFLFFVLTFIGRKYGGATGRWPMCVGASLVLLSSLLLFTRPLKKESDINAIFLYAWSFLAAALIFGAVMLYASEHKPPKNDTAQAAEAGTKRQARADQARYRPVVITMVRGCDYAVPLKPGEMETGRVKPEKNKEVPGLPEARPLNQSMPERLSCGDLPPQWVLAIGGSVLQCHYDGTCPHIDAPKEIENAKALAKQLEDTEKQIKALDARASSISEDLGNLRLLAQSGADISGHPTSSLEGSLGGIAGQKVELNKKVDDLRKRIAAAEGWDAPGRYLMGAPIVGGIVVPVYFVVLAWVGALISMMRKMPEFQNRIDPAYAAEYREKAAMADAGMPPISYGRARELVVFQILQVLSAPAIAIVAYAWARPEQLMSTVLLAFAAGFSSEIFLVAVRAVADRLIGLGPLPLRVRGTQEIAAEAAANAGTPTQPPRGPTSATPTTTPTAKFKVGDAIELALPVGPFLPGARGVVESVPSAGNVVVRVTNDHTGMPQSFVLDARPADSFQTPGKNTDTVPAPAG